MIPTLAQALSERGYEELTPVQLAVTDPALNWSDLLVSAQTGSGKTVGFGLAIAPTLLEEAEVFGPAARPMALVIAPTRELALQVRKELTWLYAKAGAVLASCVGGMDMRDERRALERGAHIAVGTPGRLRDHVQRGSLVMSHLRAVILDEADEMLDLGFREDLEFILAAAPADRRTLMFSATVPKSIATLAQTYQRDAVRISTVAERTQHADISYLAHAVAQQDGENAIINVLRFHDARNALVFANTRAMVNRLTARFSNRGFHVVALSGELSQTERTHALQAMRDGRARVCVATDVAARGIDLPNLDLVVHAELPNNPEVLLHRSGRTGRAGRKGISVLIVPVKARKGAERLLSLARLNAAWVPPPGAEEILRRDEERLLADPVWTDPIEPEEAAFVKTLLALHKPEQVAAAYLRLYRSGRSAPEELAEPAAPAPVRDPRSFGPGQWFTLNAGYKDRAEARWILPLVCNAGGITRDEIGAIRVQTNETLVEVAEAAVERFIKVLGPAMDLGSGLVLRKMEGVPSFDRSPPPPQAAPAERAFEKPRKPRTPKPRRDDSGPAPLSREQRTGWTPDSVTPPPEAPAAARRPKPMPKPGRGPFPRPPGGMDRPTGPKGKGPGRKGK